MMSSTMASPLRTRDQLIQDNQLIDLNRLKPGGVLVCDSAKFGTQLALLGKPEGYVEVMTTARGPQRKRKTVHVSEFRAVRHNPIIQGYPEGLDRALDPRGMCSYMNQVRLWSSPYNPSVVLLNGVAIWEDGHLAHLVDRIDLAKLQVGDLVSFSDTKQNRYYLEVLDDGMLSLADQDGRRLKSMPTVKLIPAKQFVSAGGDSGTVVLRRKLRIELSKAHVIDLQVDGVHDLAVNGVRLG